MTPLNNMPHRPTPSSGKPFIVAGSTNPYFKKNFSQQKPSYTEDRNSYGVNPKSQINPANFKLNSAQIMEADEYFERNYRTFLERGYVEKIIKGEQGKIDKMRINASVPTRELKNAESRLNYFKAKLGIK